MDRWSRPAAGRAASRTPRAIPAALKFRSTVERRTQVVADRHVEVMAGRHIEVVADRRVEAIVDRRVEAGMRVS